MKFALLVFPILIFTISCTNKNSNQVNKKSLKGSRSPASFAIDGVNTAKSQRDSEEVIASNEPEQIQLLFLAKNIKIFGKTAEVEKTLSPTEYDPYTDDPTLPNSCGYVREEGNFDGKPGEEVLIEFRGDLLLVNTGLKDHPDLDRKPFHTHQPRPHVKHGFDEFHEMEFYYLPIDLFQLSNGPIASSTKDGGFYTRIQNARYSVEDQKFVSVEQVVRKSDKKRVCKIVEITSEPMMKDVKSMKLKITVPHLSNTNPQTAEETCRAADPLIEYDCIPQMLGSR